jgi:hypothetical protein
MNAEIIPKVVSLMSAPLLRSVLDYIIKEKVVVFNDLAKLVTPDNEPLPKEKVAEIVSQLKDESLIGERKSQYEGFDSYYVTAEGLAANREVSRMGKSAQPAQALQARQG